MSGQLRKIGRAAARRTSLGVKGLERAVDRICERAFEAHAPDRLCHYTRTADNAVEILGSGVLWATDCKAAEGGQSDLDLATPIILEVLEELSQHERVGWAGVIDGVRADFDRRLKVSAWGTIYVVCLTPHPDNPNMWGSPFGGYGHGASIMFRMLPERRPDTDRSIGIYQVEYDHARFRTQLKSSMEEVVMAATPHGLSHSVTRQVVSGLSRLAAKASMRLKEPGCAYQHEWRVITLPKWGLKLPLFGPPESPRLHLSLRLRPGELADVERIVLGPHVTLDKVEEIRAKLRGLGYGKVQEMPEVESSAQVMSPSAPTG